MRALHERIAAYYSRKVRLHGATPAGVDWPSARGQAIRFDHLLRICDFSRPFSLDDVGCGWGALADYLRRQHAGAQVDYLGIDVSPEMVAHAARRWRGDPRVAFRVAAASPRIADYAVASGIFNVRLDESPRMWRRFVARCLHDMARGTRIGFAVNFLAPSRTDSTPQLYRPRPGHWAAFCESRLGLRVEEIGTEGLREITLLARH